jgi:hypothetical protein
MENFSHTPESFENMLRLKIQRLNEEFQGAEKEIEDYFFPLIAEALKRDSIEEARGIIRRMPDCVARVFAHDMVRQKEIEILSR